MVKDLRSVLIYPLTMVSGFKSLTTRYVVECQNVLLAEVSFKNLPLKFLTLLLLVKECFFEIAEHCVSSHGLKRRNPKNLKMSMKCGI